jgi:hypothetical protein
MTWVKQVLTTSCTSRGECRVSQPTYMAAINLQLDPPTTNRVYQALHVLPHTSLPIYLYNPTSLRSLSEHSPGHLSEWVSQARARSCRGYIIGRLYAETARTH